MTIPVTVENGVAKIPESKLEDIDIPSDSPCITVTPEVLEQRAMAFSDRDKWFQKGAFVAVKYEIHDSLQYNSAYVISHAYKKTNDLYKIILKPTHGGASSLSCSQSYKFDNRVVCERNMEKVRGGAEMILAPIDPDHILKEIGGNTKVMAHNI